MSIHNVGGLIAAAGNSSRMGTPKVLLHVDTQRGVVPLGAHLAGVFRQGGVGDVVITLPRPPFAAQVTAALDAPDLMLIDNDRWHEGLLGSIRSALAHLQTNERASNNDVSALNALVFTPVDAPFATPELVRRLIDALDIGHGDVAIPVVEGKRGHPVAIHARLFQAFSTPTAAALRDGARAIFADANVIECDWHDANVTANVNTPSDWERARAIFAARDLRGQRSSRQ